MGELQIFNSAEFGSVRTITVIAKDYGWTVGEKIEVDDNSRIENHFDCCKLPCEFCCNIKILIV